MWCDNCHVHNVKTSTETDISVEEVIYSTYKHKWTVAHRQTMHSLTRDSWSTTAWSLPTLYLSEPKAGYLPSTFIIL